MLSKEEKETIFEEREKVYKGNTIYAFSFIKNNKKVHDCLIKDKLGKTIRNVEACDGSKYTSIGQCVNDCKTIINIRQKWGN